MSGPFGPNETPGPGEGRSNDPTQVWGGQQSGGQAAPTQQNWSGQQQPPAAQPWGQSQPQWSQQPQQQWGNQPSQPAWAQPTTQHQWEPTQQQTPQWGQQPQQQWGQQPQQPWGQQPQWGQAPSQAPSLDSLTTTRKKSRKGLYAVLGAVVALIVVVVAVLAFVLGSSDKLDNKAVQDGVSKVLKDSYGIDDVQGVSCPSGQKVEVGKTFNCDLKVSGEAKHVTVKVTKTDGTYEVGRPN
ncbi:DUF4333 domain-containing protein [Nocardia sp. alder85J]|uniref:DUF4333 domain-containing protein n=1 Tax=Nocardia sp. alder85J TaxID=2862949 RepID=UPI001CD4527E|nr:DUF4333 domain-containing protein [Nocardia sp. alder85J]MCX4092809.1 DUF4333 domain-containing protein [Nocardia sp. alder85J]